MGGTYWYYVGSMSISNSYRTDRQQYKVDDDEECHNPSEPSTTLCPLLPGQRLNVLDLPIEGHGPGNPETPDVFTRNPKDRFLTPVPPAPLRPAPSPRSSGVSAASAQSHVMPLPSPWAPRSATYPPTQSLLPPKEVRHARSASASPRIPSTPAFVDLKSLKEKLAMKPSKIRCPTKSKELEIGFPVLVSTTNEELNLVPLSSLQPPTTSPGHPPSISSQEPRSIPHLTRGFSPLASHPVNPEVDSIFELSEASTFAGRSRRRRRSHVPSTVITSEFKLGQGRVRANSADTRRTQHYLFSNDPWLQSPKYQEFHKKDVEYVADDTPPAPVLSRPSSSFSQSTVVGRPVSRNGLVQSPLDKELPELPRYLKPAPLFSYRSSAATTMIAEESLEDLKTMDSGYLDDFDFDFIGQSQSRFSLWSIDSNSAMDDDMMQSPTFSTLTSDSSDYDSPHRSSVRHSLNSESESAKQTPTIFEDEQEMPLTYLSPTPPQLEDLRLSKFGSESFDLDIHHAETSPNRQAACFGLGVYSLPKDETSSKSTITEKIAQESTLNAKRDSQMSQLTKLVDEFAFLGEAVI